MTRDAKQTLIAILIERLGGEVKITREELFRADELELTEWDDPVSMTYKLTAERPPETLQGEVVEPEQQAIAPTKVKYVDAQGWNAAVMVSRGHACEAWQIIRGDDGIRYCTACGKSS